MARPAAEQAIGRWVAIFAGYLPARRPLAILDVGSGTGRLTAMLAAAFGGPVYGLEPSVRSRAVAERDGSSPAVTYLAGTASSVPLPDASCEVVVLFLSLHHIADHAAAFRELARVSATGATILIRCEFADRMPERRLYHYFPAARVADLAARRPVAEVVADAAAAGFDLVTLDTHEAGVTLTLSELYTRARRGLSAGTGVIPPPQAAAGLAALGRDAAAEESPAVRPVPADLLVLSRGPR